MSKHSVITTIAGRSHSTLEMDQDFELFAALYEDVQNGVVWIRTAEPKLTSRSVVEIANPDTRMSVFCEALSIDRNFADRYDSRFKRNFTETPYTFSSRMLANGAPAIVISEWYRRKLGIDRREGPVRLQVTSPSGWRACWGKLRACLDHPQTVVRVAMWLAIASVLLGALGAFLGFLSAILGVCAFMSSC